MCARNKVEDLIFKRALIVKKWDDTFRDLSNKKIIFTKEPSDFKIVEKIRDNKDAKISVLEKQNAILLDPENGNDTIKSYQIAAYDESIQNIQTLKGTVYFTCHCIIQLDDNDYYPICELTANYFTRVKSSVNKSDVFHFVDYLDQSSSIESEYKKIYHDERKSLLQEHVNKNSILIVDGPLIGRMLSSRTIKMVRKLEEVGILSIFVTKNSDSMMLTNSVAPGQYNSDLDWADGNLKAGQRSPFIMYKDQHAGHSEVFCYLKTFEYVSPLRISFFPEYLNKYQDLIISIMDMIYYLVLDQGTPKDPQVRMIHIAELYAKEIMKVANPYGKMIRMGLVPTINQSRFGR